MTEIWRDIPGFEDRYQVSDQGRVRSLRRHGRILRGGIGSHGYHNVALGRVGSVHLTHKLVLLAFVGPANGLHGRHLDGDPSNNRLENLAYGTRLDNYVDKVRHGRGHAGEGHPRAKVTDAEARLIKAWPSGQRTGLYAAFSHLPRGSIDRVRSRTGWQHITGV